MLRVLDHLFYQRLSKDAILPPADIKNIFTNLEEILQLHGTSARVTPPVNPRQRRWPAAKNKDVCSLFSFDTGANGGRSEEERVFGH